MLYSIFNSDGEGRGTFLLPDIHKTAEVIAQKLGNELEHVLGVNAVRSCPLFISTSGEKEDRVFVDIGSIYSKEDERVELVHSIINRLVVPEVD